MKRLFRKTIVLSLITVCISALFFSSSKESQAVDSKEAFELIAHRGFEDQFPENTIYSARQAIEFGANIEFDIQFTADGKMVVIHDITVDRTTTGKGVVSELDFAYIDSLDAGIKFSKDYKGVKVPRFEEYLNAVKKAKHIYPELKTYRKEEDVIEFTKLLIDYDFEDKATILTFDYEKLLPLIRKVSKDISVGALCKDQQAFDKNIKIAEKDKNSELLITYTIANKRNLQLCKKQGIKIGVWTITDMRQLNRIRRNGYDRFICTKYMN